MFILLKDEHTLLNVAHIERFDLPNPGEIYATGPGEGTVEETGELIFSVEPTDENFENEAPICELAFEVWKVLQDFIRADVRIIEMKELERIARSTLGIPEA